MKQASGCPDLEPLVPPPASRRKAEANQAGGLFVGLCGDARPGLMNKRLATVAASTLAVAAAVLLSGCAGSFQAPEEQLAVRALELTYPPLAASAYRDIDARLAAGEINEAGAELLREQVGAHGETIATMRTGGR